MALKLRVISDHYKKLGKSSSRLFGVTGGRIGRSPDNDWVLPDPERYVSSHHCRVVFRAGHWILEDTSTNGVFVNGSDTPVSVDGPYTLKDGDRLRLGDYEVLVSIDERNDFPPDASGQIPILHPVRHAPAGNEDLGEEFDLADLLGDAAAKASPAVPPSIPPKNSQPLEEFDLERALGLELSPKPVERASSKASASKPAHSGFTSLLDAPTDEVAALRAVTHGRSDDWQMQTRPYDRKTLTALTAPGALARKDKAEPDRPKRTGGGPADANGVEAFCRGAGIDPASLPLDTQNALLTLAGQMLREVVLGLMEALKNRADCKGHLKLNQTAIQPADNNPLKLSASVDEALLKLLDGHSSRYLGPVEAIRDSFADLRAHQQALSDAMRAALNELMNRIEPGELQERFDRGLKRGAILGAANRMKYWDLYVEFYKALNQRNDQGLPVLFAEEFARNYAERASAKKK